MRVHQTAALIALLAPFTPGQTLLASDVGRVSPSTPGPLDRFGEHLIISGDWAIGGARFDDGPGVDSGTAYIFRWNGTSWTQFQELVPANLTAGSQYGASVAIQGDVAAVGAPRADNSIGEAYTFGFDPLTNRWVELQTLSPASGGGFFGEGIGISADYTVVGAPLDDNQASDSGSVTIFERDRNGTPNDILDDVWLLLERRFSQPEQFQAHFGEVLSMEADTFVVGVPDENAPWQGSGAAYVFKRSGSNWTQTSKLFAPANANGDAFGTDVAIRDAIIVCGAPGYDASTIDQGAAFVFEQVFGVYALTGILTAFDANAWDALGCGVAVSGENIVVGASGRDDTGVDSGAAYLFRKTSLGWESMERLTASDASNNSWFGVDVELQGDRLLIGASRANQGALTSGTAYAFQLTFGDFELMGFGDGSLSSSPCSNESFPGLYQGALNSSGFGARLTPMGTDRLQTDDLQFVASNLLPLASALLFVGTDATTPLPLGDGLLVAGGSIRRLGVRSPNAQGIANWGPGILSSLSLSVGDRRYFQVWYRDTFASPCGAGFNTSGVVAVAFQ